MQAYALLPLVWRYTFPVAGVPRHLNLWYPGCFHRVFHNMPFDNSLSEHVR